MGCCGNWCRSCCQSLGKFALLWINFVDLACGGAAIGFGVYLKTAGADSPLIDDVALASLALGGVFLLSSVLGFLGVVFSDSGCLMKTSACLAIPIAITEFAGGVGLATMKPHVTKYLDGHAASVDEDVVSRWYFVVVGALFGAAFLELLRYKMTVSLKRSLSADVDRMYRSLNDDEADARERQADASEARRERYAAMREHFKAKYAPPDPDAVAPDSSDEEAGAAPPKPKESPWYTSL